VCVCVCLCVFVCARERARGHAHVAWACSFECARALLHACKSDRAEL